MKKCTLAGIIAGALLISGCGSSADRENRDGSLGSPEAGADKQAQREAIERVLREDVAAGANSGGQGIKDPVVTAPIMQQIDLNPAPEDFRRAFQAHVRAWEDLARLESSARTERADSPAQSRITEERRRITGDLATTFEEVLRIARTHGARIPPEAEPSAAPVPNSASPLSPVNALQGKVR